jgi:tRNA threonylcarbamoyl adenosine modification protein YeaZ
VLLAIDTSTDSISLALAQEGCMLAELTWRCGQNHSVELLPRLTYLLERVKADLKLLAGVVVAIGPGSFNGLRVGVTTAKGLAFSLGIPLVGISTLETSAFQHAETGLPVCPVANAGRGEVAAALFQQKNGAWLRLVEEHITTVDAICAGVDHKTVFCGEHVLAIDQKLLEKLGEKAIIPHRSALARRAGFLAELGQRRLETGKHDNPATLQPLYLRRPPITTPKKPITLLGARNDKLAQHTA